MTLFLNFLNYSQREQINIESKTIIKSNKQNMVFGVRSIHKKADIINTATLLFDIDM